MVLLSCEVSLHSIEERHPTQTVRARYANTERLIEPVTETQLEQGAFLRFLTDRRRTLEFPVDAATARAAIRLMERGSAPLRLTVETWDEMGGT